MTTTPTSGAADLPEALRSIQRFEVVDCIDDKHVPAVIPKPHGPWVRYEDHIAALAAGQATAAPAAVAGPSLYQMMAAIKAIHATTPDADDWDSLRQCEVDALRGRAEKVLAALAAAPTTQPAPQLPERDASVPAEQQGLFRKFDVRRVDGSDQPGEKHHGCRYFVLDVDHDQHAHAALTAYAAACESSHPELAADLRSKWGAAPTTQQAGTAEVVECGNLYAKVKLRGDAFGSTNVGDVFYSAPQTAPQQSGVGISGFF